MSQDSNNRNDNPLRILTKENCQQIAEICGAESFVLITCESKLPCEDSLVGLCTEGHRYGFSVYHVDHAHTVQTLEMALEKVTRQGLGDSAL